jgi:hypothetical protein
MTMTILLPGQGKRKSETRKVVATLKAGRRKARLNIEILN